MTQPPTPQDEARVDEYQEAQDVIDALRFLFVAQKDPAQRAALTEALLEQAPETDSDRGVNLVLTLLAEGDLKAEIV